MSAQSVSRGETCATCPDVTLLPELAKLSGALVGALFCPCPNGYDNRALRLEAQGLEEEAQMPRTMAEKCRAQMFT